MITEAPTQLYPEPPDHEKEDAEAEGSGIDPKLKVDIGAPYLVAVVKDMNLLVLAKVDDNATATIQIVEFGGSAVATEAIRFMRTPEGVEPGRWIRGNINGKSKQMIEELKLSKARKLLTPRHKQLHVVGK